MSVDRRPCPARCGRHVSTGHLLCPPCWKKVPKDLRSRVNRTWSAWTTVGLADRDAAAAYRAAAEEATAAALHPVYFGRARAR
jgi:hypothetical protein